MKSKTAACERSGIKILLSDGFFVADPSTGEWSFVSVDAPARHGEYNVPVSSIIKSSESLVDWMANLNEKTWFNAKKFADFFTRFRKDNSLYNAL